MEVKPTGSKMVNPKSESSGRTSGVNVRQSSFLDSLKASDSEQRKQACDNILKEIESLSEELKKAPTPEGIKKYRKLVTAFLKEALNNTYEINEESHWDRSGNRKTYITVKKINKSLEELVDAVMNREKKQIDLVAKLDEIRGLLLDLYF